MKLNLFQTYSLELLCCVSLQLAKGKYWLTHVLRSPWQRFHLMRGLIRLKIHASSLIKSFVSFGIQTLYSILLIYQSPSNKIQRKSTVYLFLTSNGAGSQFCDNGGLWIKLYNIRLSFECKVWMRLWVPLNILLSGHDLIFKPKQIV